MARIPVSATNLSPIPPVLPKAKLSIDALCELVDLAQKLHITEKKEDRNERL